MMRSALVIAALFLCSAVLSQTAKQPTGATTAKVPSAPIVEKPEKEKSPEYAADVKRPADPSQETSQTPSRLSVARAAIATGIVENEPENAGVTFPTDVKKLYCFSQIKGTADSTQIEHRWYWNDDLKLSVPLAIKSANWRTYSRKNIPPGMTGEWKVSIVDTKNEAVLESLVFTIK